MREASRGAQRRVSLRSTRSQEGCLSETAKRYAFGPYELDSGQRLLFCRGEIVQIPPKVFDTLLALVESAGELVTREALLERIWPNTFVEEGNLSQNVFALRRLLAEAGGDDLYIETFPRRGYRFVVPVREVAPAGPRGKVRRWMPVAAAVAAALVLVVWLAQRAERGGGPGSAPGAGEPAISLAVLPFRSLPAAAGVDDRALRLGMADALVVRLGGVGRLAVRPTSEVAAYVDDPVEPSVAARRLNVDWLLDGGLQREGDRIRVTVQLLGSRGERVTWAESFDEPFDSIFSLQDRLARRVAERLVPRLEQEELERLVVAPTDSQDAYALYLEARYHTLRLVDHERAIAGFREAVDRDPAFAQAHAGLAFAYLMANELWLAPAASQPLARRAALRALELDDNLTEARLVLATVLWQYDWAPAAAERHYRRALESEPRSAVNHAWFVLFLAFQGRADEAWAEAGTALGLEPRSIEVNLAVCPALYFTRRYAETRELCERFVDLEPAAWLGHTTLGRIAEQEGRWDDALAHYRLAVEVGGDVPETRMDLGRALALAGRPQEALEVAAELDRLAATSFVSPFHRAMIALGLEDRSRALDLLAEALDQRSWYSTWLPIAPELDPLRGEPRFRELEARLAGGG